MTQPVKTSLLAIFSLVFSFLCFPIGLLLGVLAMVKINKSNGALEGKGLAIAAIVISAGIALPGTGCLAAIAIPNFVKFQCRAKQSEAKTNLKGLYVAQESYRAEHDTYTTSMTDLQFKAYGSNVRYQYNITRADKEHFEASATAVVDELRGDTFTITERNNLTNTVPGC